MYLSSFEFDDGRRCRAWRTNNGYRSGSGFADAIILLAERLRRLRLRFERELARLNAIKGPELSVSLELLVAQICDMWSQETGRPVTANPYRGYDYTGRPQTDAGRFVLRAAEALQPSKAWSGRYGAAAPQKRAMIVMGTPSFQAQAVHTAMRKYVAAPRSWRRDAPFGQNIFCKTNA